MSKACYIIVIFYMFRFYSMFLILRYYSVQISMEISIFIFVFVEISSHDLIR